MRRFFCTPLPMLLALASGSAFAETATQTAAAQNGAADILKTLANTVVSEFSHVGALYQFLAIIAAALVALLISRIIRHRITPHIPKAQDGKLTLMQKAMGFVLHVFMSVVFSVIAASILALSVWSMKELGIITPREKLVLVRIAYSIFYAWALLLMLLRFFAVTFGERIFGTALRRAVTVVFWILAALQIVGVLPLLTSAMQSIYIPIGSGKVTLWSGIVGLFTVLITLGAANSIANALEGAITANNTIEPNLRVVFSRLIRVVLIVSAVLVALSTVGIDLTVLSVFSGAIGVGVGFGMQKIASNYISGFIILFDRSIKIGDYINVAGFSGVVTQINTRYSVIRNTAAEELIVPNETFVTSTVKNFSLTERACVCTLDTTISYDADSARALAILIECAERQPRVLHDEQHKTWAVVKGLGDSGWDLQVGFWVKDPEQGTLGVKSGIYRESMDMFDAEGIDIPYSRIDLFVKNGVTLSTENPDAKKK